MIRAKTAIPFVLWAVALLPTACKRRASTGTMAGAALPDRASQPGTVGSDLPRGAAIGSTAVHAPADAGDEVGLRWRAVCTEVQVGERVAALDCEVPNHEGATRAVVLVPRSSASPAPNSRGGGPTEGRWGLVVALHGRGEALKGPVDGPWGWPRDYALFRAMERLYAPPLVSEDFEGLATPAERAAYNAVLDAAPFEGLVVLCPYLPDLSRDTLKDARAYARYLATSLVPWARAHLPVRPHTEDTGVDGVSLGGFAALVAGFSHPNVFGAVGGLQPAISDGQFPEWLDLVRAARTVNPAQRLRLVTSEKDFFRGVTSRFSGALTRAGIPHGFLLTQGPHDYVWNRGPGAFALLMFAHEGRRPDAPPSPE